MNVQAKYYDKPFGHPRPPVFNEYDLLKLATEMHRLDLGAFSEIPSGYVYFGQFLMHDVSKLSIGDRSPNPKTSTKVDNLRNKYFYLETIYGQGFDDVQVAVDKSNGRLLLKSVKEPPGHYGSIVGYDLPRDNESGKARIGDSRNDGNLLLAQLHVQFIKLHNFFSDKIELSNGLLSPKEIYEGARIELIRHYHQVILYDWLKVILNEKVWLEIIGKSKHVLWDKKYFQRSGLPVEFTGAVARFGHAMVRREYILNNQQSANIETIVGMTKQGNFMGSGSLPSTHIVDWRYFFKFGEGVRYPINTAQKISPEVHLSIPKLPIDDDCEMEPMATRIFQRGNQLKVPDAQSVIHQVMNVDSNFADEIGLDILVDELKVCGVCDKTDILSKLTKEADLECHTPLWYYILAEAYNASGPKKGERLGPLGSLILAEVINGLITSSSIFQKTQNKAWSSKYISQSGEYLQMGDLLYAVN